MEICYWIHVFTIIIFFTIPFWNNNYLQYGAYIPLALSIIWTLNGGCPIGKYHTVHNKHNNFDYQYFLLIQNNK